MMRYISAAIFFIGLGAMTAAQAGDAKTIRVEPRAFYGATVSLEAGVRVFRPLPATTHMIINPNKSPVHISLKEVTKTVNSTSRHYHSGNASGYSGGRVVGNYVPGGFKGHRRRGGKFKRGGRGAGL